MHLKSIPFSTEDLYNGEGLSATHPIHNERSQNKMKQMSLVWC